MVLRRSADVLSSLSIEGEWRHLELAFQDADPLPGEIRERAATPEEVSALVDSYARGVATMLLASSLECLLKAKLTTNGIQLISEDGILHKRFRTHNLRRLAVDAGLGLHEADLTVLDGLTAFLEWRGRYPIPTKWERLRDLNSMEFGSIGDFQARAFALADRIVRSVSSLISEAV